MPRKYIGSWSGPPHYRWVFFRKDVGKKRVNCSVLGIPRSDWTEDKSYQPAKQFWFSWLESIKPTNPNQPTINELNRRLLYSKKHGLENEIPKLETNLQRVESLETKLAPGARGLIWGAIEEKEFHTTPNDYPLLAGPDAKGTIVVPSHEQAIWNDRLKNVAPVSDDRTAEHFKKLFLAFHLGQAAMNGKSLGRFLNLKTGVTKFVEWFGATRDIAEITDDVCKEYFQHLGKRVKLGGRGNSNDTVGDHWQVFKQFVSETTLDAKIPFPEMLRVKKYFIPKIRKEPNPWTLEEIKVVLDNATDQLKAYLMLFLNCGYYQGDICDLLASQVDWKLGRINRARSKASNAMKGNDPIKINWRLWDATFDILKSQGRRIGNVFIGEDGKPLKIEKLNEEKQSGSRQDKISRMFVAYLGKLIEQEKLPADFSKDLMDLRKTGSDVLDKSEDHSAAVDVYLNHASLAASNYIKSGQVKPAFDKAVKWYGEQLGFRTARK